MLNKIDCIKGDYSFYLDENDKKPTVPPKKKISSYIEGKRILPPSSPFPGFWQNDFTPYSVEIMDNMSPSSPVQHSAIMKGGQLGLTAAAENVVAYYMDEYPTEQLFISATTRLLDKWVTKRLEPVIDSCGIRPKVYHQSENKHSRKSGDKTFCKEYVGGTLDMASAQSAASLRADSKRVLIRDEIDGAPAQLKSGEGNYLDVSYVRTNAWGDRRKVLDISTPTLFEDSLIYQLYLDGDQRKFFVPCPHCGEMQFLEWGNEQSDYGMKGVLKDGRLQEVYYQCKECKGKIYNHHKSTMLAKGEWRATAVSHSDHYRSYHLSSLYSPIGMLTWFELYETFLKADEKPDGMRSFVNLYLGEPYKEKGSRPGLEKLIESRGTYKEGTVPDGVLFLTAAVDVQRGSASDENNPARLEMEVCGHGAGYRTYSITYQRFEGSIDVPNEGAWEKLNEYAAETGLTYKRKDGQPFTVVLVFIDSGDGQVTDIVYSFCQGWQSTYPIKGFGNLRKRKGEKGDEESFMNFKKYRPVKVGEDTILYEISTNYYKKHLYNNLKIERRDVGPQRAGFCDFPITYGEKYFNMLRAEEMRKDGSFYCPSGRRNEALDVRVYNQCASDVFVASMVLDMREKARTAGATKDQLAMINGKYVLDYLTSQIL